VARSDDHRPLRRAAFKTEQAGRPRADERRHLDELLDEALKETFPASDAVAVVLQPPEPPLAKRTRRASAG